MKKLWWIPGVTLVVLLAMVLLDRPDTDRTVPEPSASDRGTRDESGGHPAFPATPTPLARPVLRQAVPPGCVPAKEALQRGEASDMIMLVPDLLREQRCSQTDLHGLLKDAAGAQSEDVRDAAVTGLESLARAACLEENQRKRQTCRAMLPDVEGATACLQKVNAEGMRVCVADYFESEKLTPARLDHQTRGLEPHCTLGLRGEWDETRGRVNAEIDQEIGGDPTKQNRAEDFRAVVTNVSLDLCAGVLEKIDPRFVPWQQLHLKSRQEFVERYILPWLNAYALQDRAAGPDDAQRASREEIGAAWGLTRTNGLWTLPAR